MSAETFWEGMMDAGALQAHLESRARVKVILGAQACQAAIQRYGGIRRISLITPYMPSGDAQVRRSFTDSGFEVVNLLGLKCNSPLLMAHESPERLRRAVREVDDPSVELILQVGTNLAFGRVAAEAERWLGKPVLAVNTCTYWHALRAGIETVEASVALRTEGSEGFGRRLLALNRLIFAPYSRRPPCAPSAPVPASPTSGTRSAATWRGAPMKWSGSATRSSR